MAGTVALIGEDPCGGEHLIAMSLLRRHFRQLFLSYLHANHTRRYRSGSAWTVRFSWEGGFARLERNPTARKALAAIIPPISVGHEDVQHRLMSIAEPAKASQNVRWKPTLCGLHGEIQSSLEHRDKRHRDCKRLAIRDLQLPPFTHSPAASHRMAKAHIVSSPPDFLLLLKQGGVELRSRDIKVTYNRLLGMELALTFSVTYHHPPKMLAKLLILPSILFLSVVAARKFPSRHVLRLID